MDMETGAKPQASVSTLSMTLGLFALGIAWRNAAKMFSIPPAIGETILLLTGCLWLFLLSRYVHQVLSSSNGVSRELLLQLQNPFLTLIPITTGLASFALHPYASLLAHILLFIGVTGQLLFSSYHISGQWHGNTPSEMETPAMYMPTVGANFASAIALGAFGYSHWGYVFFGAGFLSWMSLEATYLYHLRSSEPLHPEQRALLGIQLAPAFVGSSAYLSCNGGQIDMVVLGLIGYGPAQPLLHGAPHGLGPAPRPLDVALGLLFRHGLHGQCRFPPLMRRARRFVHPARPPLRHARHDCHRAADWRDAPARHHKQKEKEPHRMMGSFFSPWFTPLRRTTPDGAA